ncbi:MAG TPA: hypothetical protein VJR92_09555 [Gemmatimonadaceae bacterium]|nr:hypothetical protein [Gemmatimonadaceae bacterium]
MIRTHDPGACVRLIIGSTLFVLVACTGDSGTPPEPPCDTPTTFQVGEVRTFSGPADVACIVIARTSAASEFIVITANVTEGAQARAYTVSSSLAPSAAANAASSLALPDVSGSIEARIRRREQQRLAARTSAIAPSRARANASRPRGITAAVATGDTITYRVADVASGDQCANYTEVRAVVRALGTTTIIAQDVLASATGFTTDDFNAMSAQFDATIVPTTIDWFGAPSDINGDSRVTVLITPKINALTPPGSSGYVSGFFLYSDFLPRAAAAESPACASSNEQEILYLLAPDPNGTINGNRISVETAWESARGTTAHELQHMISYGVRATGGAEPEAIWLNEGLSHLAEEVAGRAMRGYSDARSLTWNDVLADLDAFDSFFRQNLLRFRLWMTRPDLSSPLSDNAATQLASRGAAWALVRYSIDQYAGANQRAFTRALVTGPQSGVQNLAARTGASTDDLLGGFLVAHGAAPAIAGLNARFRYTTWAMRDVMSELTGGTYPLAVTALPAMVNTQSWFGSGNYFVLTRAAGERATTLHMRSGDGEPVTFDGARVHVARVK